MTNQEKQFKFIELRADGHSLEACANELGVSKATTGKWNQKLDNEVQSLKNLKLKELYEKSYMTKEARIKGFASTLEKVRERIEDGYQKGELKKLSMRDAFEIESRTMKALKSEFVPIMDEETPLAKKGEDITFTDIQNLFIHTIGQIRKGEINTYQAEMILNAAVKLNDVKANVELAQQVEDIKAQLEGQLDASE